MTSKTVEEGGEEEDCKKNLKKWF